MCVYNRTYIIILHRSFLIVTMSHTLIPALTFVSAYIGFCMYNVHVVVDQLSDQFCNWMNSDKYNHYDSEIDSRADACRAAMQQIKSTWYTQLYYKTIMIYDCALIRIKWIKQAIQLYIVITIEH